MRKYFIIGTILLIILCLSVGCDKFKSTPKDTSEKVVVTFVNWDGTVLQKSKVAKGGNVYPPVDPTRPEDEDNTYTFLKWDKEITGVAEDMTVTAEYTAHHVIRVNLNLDGELFYSAKFKEIIKMSAFPTPTSTDKEFDNWYGVDDYTTPITIEFLVKNYDINDQDVDFEFYGKWKEPTEEEE